MSCEILLRRANRALWNRQKRKQFMISAGQPCPTLTEGQPGPLTDLVILIDTSGSMGDEAKALSAAADAAIDAAMINCPAQLKVTWLGLEGTWPDTLFKQSLRDYLHHLGVPDEQIRVRKAGSLVAQGAQEDGGRAIEDISRHFDWRPRANRVIFYLSDEGLEGGNPQDQEDVVAANRAIAVANSRNVSIYTYAGTGVDEKIKQEYARIASQTGGQTFSASLDGFEKTLEQIICGSVTHCETVDVPEIKPCFELYWGQRPDDQLTTTDRQILYITAKNHYSNVTFKDLTVILSAFTKNDGTPIERAADRLPAVFVQPSIICFGDVSPCRPNHKHGEVFCVSREVILSTQGADSGEYLLEFDYYHTIEFESHNTDQFKFNLVAG